MKYFDVLKLAGEKSGISMRQASLELGHNARYIATQKTMNRTPSVSNAARMLDVCGYSLVAIPKERVTSDMLVIDDDRQENKQ